MDGLCHCVRPDLQKLGEDLYCLSCGYASLGKTENQHFKPEGPGNTVIHLTGRAKFHYRPLQSPHALRLVHLYAGHRKDEIRCRIFHATLEDHPVFEALSYTWGDSILSHEIYSDEGTVRVTANCASALRDLRHTSRDRFLWIDAICINQASNAEKNHQVPLMNKIYAAAIRVVIYIGPDPADDADRFFDYFRPHYLRPDSACMAARKIVDQDHVSAFLSKSWFSRIWVLQEVAVAREAVLMCGLASINWKYFSAARLNAMGRLPIDRSKKVPPVMLLSHDIPKPLKDFISLIHTARSCEASDPRDRVFALLGLLSIQVSDDLVPGYNKSVETIYANLTATTVEFYRHLDILSLAGNETYDERQAAEKLAWKVAALKPRVLVPDHELEAAVDRIEADIQNVLDTSGVRVTALALITAESTECRALIDLFRKVQMAEDDWMELFEKSDILRDLPYALSEWHGESKLRWIFPHGKPSQSQAEPKVIETQGLGRLGALWGSLQELKVLEEEELRRLEALWRSLQEFKDERRKGRGNGPLMNEKRCKFEQQHEVWLAGGEELDRKRYELRRDRRELLELLQKNDAIGRDGWPRSEFQSLKIVPKWRGFRLHERKEEAHNAYQQRVREVLYKMRKTEETGGLELNYWEAAWLAKLRALPTSILAHPIEQGSPIALWNHTRFPSLSAQSYINSYAEWHGLQKEHQNFLETKRVISEGLHSNLRFSSDGTRSTNAAFPSWTVDLASHQSLSSLTHHLAKPSKFQGSVARLCNSPHSHETPALEIRFLEIDEVSSEQGHTPDISSEDGMLRSSLNEASPSSQQLAAPNSSSTIDAEDSLSHVLEALLTRSLSSTLDSFVDFCIGRRCMPTHHSWVICSGRVREHDKICVLYGASVPFVLRPVQVNESHASFKLLGECYLHGLAGFRFDGDYLGLLCDYGKHFDAKSVDELPWKRVCLV